MNDRRVFPRHTLKQPLACFVYASSGQTAGLAAAANISLGGLGFRATAQPQHGELLGVVLVDVPAPLRRQLLLRVVYAKADPSGGYFVGGQFLQKLSTSQMQGLVGLVG